MSHRDATFASERTRKRLDLIRAQSSPFVALDAKDAASSPERSVFSLGIG